MFSIQLSKLVHCQFFILIHNSFIIYKYYKNFFQIQRCSVIQIVSTDNGRHGLPWHFEALLTNGTLPRHTPHFVARVLSPVTNRWGMLWCILRGGISWVSMLYRWARGVRIALGTLFIGVRHATAAFSWGVRVLSTFSFNGPFNCNTKITKKFKSQEVYMCLQVIHVLTSHKTHQLFKNKRK